MGGSVFFVQLALLFVVVVVFRWVALGSHCFLVKLLLWLLCFHCLAIVLVFVLASFLIACRFPLRIVFFAICHFLCFLQTLFPLESLLVLKFCLHRL